MSAGRRHEEFLRFADGVRRILRGVILWSEGHPDGSSRLRRRVERSARRSLTRLLNEPWRDSDAVRIAKELRHRRRQLFTFVIEPGVPWQVCGFRLPRMLWAQARRVAVDLQRHLHLPVGSLRRQVSAPSGA